MILAYWPFHIQDESNGPDDFFGERYLHVWNRGNDYSTDNKSAIDSTHHFAASNRGLSPVDQVINRIGYKGDRAITE